MADGSPVGSPPGYLAMLSRQHPGTAPGAIG
jgi:hypothetical protein